MTTKIQDPKRRIIGIDFSGSKRAGRKIWISTGHLGDGKLTIESCRRLAYFTTDKSLSQIDQALPYLEGFLAKQTDALVGLDFPFSVPEQLMSGCTWPEFVTGFATQFPTPEKFRQYCRSVSPGTELKRLTDKEAKTPFSPYNLWLFRQTYYGIRDVLAPLVREGAVCVLPMQSAQQGKPWLLEICPASTLRSLGLTGVSYKGRQPEKQEARVRLLSRLGDLGVTIPSKELVKEIVEDPEGDALDSVIAAFAVARNIDSMADLNERLCALEGWVYC